eukprot:TRINITY_DN25376_c0_g1_i1.p1 TRINITY_DN25376_c0_g1~~TRINITY_DN25376_c0_g1_i1.p1  ORF type:complete len:802 (-),score=122.38 TRINITY_DN25376_c0_g1_i1:24-2267(-)
MTRVPAFDISSSSLKFKMPEDVGKAAESSVAYSMTVGDSQPFLINTPDVWWWQGDQGNVSTPGGWLRVFGRCIQSSASATALEASSERVVTLEKHLLKATREASFEVAEQILAQLKAMKKSLNIAKPQIRLTSENQSHSPVILTAFNFSEFDANFAIPATLEPGTFKAEISAGSTPDGQGPWFPLKMFATPSTPDLSKVTVRAPRSWKSDVFQVDCDWHKDVFSRPCGWVGARSSLQVDAALAKARANGGGIVYLPRGQYYVDGPLVIPDGVVLKGESTKLVSIYFKEDNPATSPHPGYIHANNSASAWAVTDLTVYVTHHYWSVFYVHPTCSDWTLQRVRVRAAAWAFLWDPQKGAGSRGRVANFTQEDIGEVIYLDGCSNFKIFDNDLLGTAIIIHSGLPKAGASGSASNGIVARNTIWNGNAGHWFDDVKQVIFEYNSIHPGGTFLNFGNNVDNYGDGYCQHIFHAHNVVEKVWGGDREMMTTDPINGDYFGHVNVQLGEDQRPLLHLINGTGQVGAGRVGGMVSVLHGTGAGQYRRIVEIINGLNLRIDRAFTTPLDKSSLVQVGPFKGRLIFYSNRYVDGGAFQLYGNDADVIVAKQRLSRMGGLLSWGRSNGDGKSFAPNLRIQFMDNEIEEGNHLFNYYGGYAYPHPKVVEPYSIGCLASDQDDEQTKYQGAINHLVVIKRNSIHNNGGIQIRGHTTNVIAENNHIYNSSIGVHVNNTHTSHIFVKHPNSLDQRSVVSYV